MHVSLPGISKNPAPKAGQADTAAGEAAGADFFAGKSAAKAAEAATANAPTHVVDKIFIEHPQTR